MHRRTFLAGFAGLFGGCTGLGADAGDAADRVTPAPVPSATETARRSRDRDPLDGRACPTFDLRTDQTVCSHAQSETAPLALTPSRPVVTLADGVPASPLWFTLHWRGAGDLSVFTESWYLRRRTDGGWMRAADTPSSSRLVTLDSGEQFTWVLGGDSTGRAVTVEATLEPGSYAFAVQTVGSESRLHSECLALFDAVEERG
ncbi:hypothetical protein [Haloarcula nitratireducens]|uniref:Lipoprotein n=1 Tax=Haloarcula nitratireducens TaxID=2487749 RepID=A0AAW4PAV3_9EURY|nr:hypothetical protein [Halomicroarcula nitratireducens]MBX0295034.1 hypothetical protein [Halomicroarcula nitratireducens]